MSRPFDVYLPHEESLRRRALFAIRLLDAVTLSTVSQGLKVVAEGLNGKPIVNASGLFVWLEEDVARLQKVSIDPGILVYLARHCGYTASKLDELLNEESGLKGVSGISSVMREIVKAMDRGDERAHLAFDIYTHRLCRESDGNSDLAEHHHGKPG